MTDRKTTVVYNVEAYTLEGWTAAYFNIPTAEEAKEIVSDDPGFEGVDVRIVKKTSEVVFEKKGANE